MICDKDSEAMILSAEIEPIDSHVDIVIAPHAGYVYSGGVAAYGFKAVSHNQYNTIVILAPSHFFGFDGVSLERRGVSDTAWCC